MGDTRMRRQFGHGLSVTGQRFALQCAQTFEQVLRLGVRGGGGYIEPDQLPGRHAPAAELQGQTGEVRRKDLRTAVGRQLFVLIL